MSSDLRAGEVFAERYRIERTLKSGGMGSLYVAVHVATRKRVALKLMRPEIVDDPGLRRRFAQEATVASLIESPGIVDVLDAGIDPATSVPFLVMELLTGQDLSEVLRDHEARNGKAGLPPAQVLDWLRQAARALGEAHEKGVVHRDLKPENLFLAERRGETPRIKILDFGIAKIREGAGRHTTHPGGTALYMAPEQTRRGDITPAADIWAFGLLAYTLLVGVPYWVADSIHQLYAEILSGHYPSAVERAATRLVILPKDFDAWFFRCVETDPDKRFASIGAAVDALAPVIARFATSEKAPQPNVNETVPWSPKTEIVRTEIVATEPMQASEREVPPSADAPVSSTTGPIVSEEAESEPSSETVPSRGPEVSTRKRGGATAWFPLLLMALIGGITIYVLVDFYPKDHRNPSNAAATTTMTIPTATAIPLPEGKHCAAGMVAIAGGTVAGRTVSPFCIQVKEVTVNEYGGCVAAGKCGAPDAYKANDATYGKFCNWKRLGAETHPINCVKPVEAKKYCAWLQLRLPTEEEFDWVSHGGIRATPYPWGDALAAGQLCASTDHTCAVGSVVAGASPEGVNDLVGNVNEIVDFIDGAAKVTARGGSFLDGTTASASMLVSQANAPNSATGFRCANQP